jgi:hypothetical protein
MLRFACLLCVVVGLIGCSEMPTIPTRINEVLPTSFAEADSLYNVLGTTMFPCTTTSVYGQLSVAVSKKTMSGKIADVAISYGGTKILRDSVSTTDVYGVDVLVNKQYDVQNIAVVLGDKDYAGNAMLRKLIVNGEIVSGIYPFGEAKLFGDDKIISYQFVSTGPMRGMSIKRYIIYDVATKSIVSWFDQQ